MKYTAIAKLLLLVLNFGITPANSNEPTVLVSLLVRDKAHTLPYFLKLFEELDYPKEKLKLRIHVDESNDRSLIMIQRWVAQNLYATEFQRHRSPQVEGDLNGNWTSDRINYVASLKEDALVRAREISADYVWFLDCDVFLNNPNTLKILVGFNKTIVAPLMDVMGYYFNFHLEPFQSPDLNLKRFRRGCFEVAIVHNCFLINIKQSEAKGLTFLAKNDDHSVHGLSFGTETQLFLSMKAINESSWICNTEKFGFMMKPLTRNQTVKDDYDHLFQLKKIVLANYSPMSEHPLLADLMPTYFLPNFGLDEMYYINMDRRPDRAKRVEQHAKFFGLKLKRFSAVDGRLLTASYLNSLGLTPYENFTDCPFPNGTFPKRHVTMTDIGCGLSHYFLWKEIADRKLERTAIFEDDVRFEKHFRRGLSDLLDEVDRLNLDWDMLYLQITKDGPKVEGSNLVRHIGLTYLLVGYVVSRQGVQKLLDGDNLNRFIPVDLYVAVRYGGGRDWCNPYLIDDWPEEQKNVKVYSVDKWLVRQWDYVESDSDRYKRKPAFYINGTIVQDGVVIDDGSLVTVPSTSEPVSVSEPASIYWIWAVIVSIFIVMARRPCKRLLMRLVGFALVRIFGVGIFMWLENKAENLYRYFKLIKLSN